MKKKKNLNGNIILNYISKRVILRYKAGVIIKGGFNFVNIY